MEGNRRDNQGGSTVLLVLVLADVLEVLSEGDLEAVLVVLVKAVVLESVEGNGGLQDVLEVHKTQQVLPPAHRGLLDEADALEARKGPENV